jgi:hypothetical protein
VNDFFETLIKTYPDNLLEDFLGENGLTHNPPKPEDDLIAYWLAGQADQLYRENPEKAADNLVGLITTVTEELKAVQNALDPYANESVETLLAEMREIFFPLATRATINVEQDDENVYVSSVHFFFGSEELTFNKLGDVTLMETFGRVQSYDT